MIIQGTSVSGRTIGTYGIPSAPTSVSATVDSITSVTVSFTTPTWTGGLPITSYTVVDNNGTTTTGVSSPITVTGLTTGTPYTFTVYATNSYGNSPNSSVSNSVTPQPTTGQMEFTTPGTYNWTVPVGVTSISAVAIGGGAGAGGQGYGTGGSGGSLSYLNNFTVTPGQTITITVANTTKGRSYDGINDPSPSANAGFSSSMVYNSSTILRAKGGDSSETNIGTASYTGGAGGVGWYDYGAGNNFRPGSGGGAAGYSGNGGAGGSGAINTKCAGTSGSGGGGGGGAVWIAAGVNGSGGGVGIFGQGASGSGGNPSTQYDSSNFAGGGGSGGNNGGYGNSVTGGSYGGGGSGGTGGFNSTTVGGDGAQGAVRIIYPGDVRQFPATRTSNE